MWIEEKIIIITQKFPERWKTFQGFPLNKQADTDWTGAGIANLK